MEQPEQVESRENTHVSETSTNTGPNANNDASKSCVYLAGLDSHKKSNLIIVDMQKDTVICVEPSNTDNDRTQNDSSDDRPNTPSDPSSPSAPNVVALSDNTTGYSSSPVPVYQQGSPQQHTYPPQPTYPGQGYPQNPSYPHPEGYPQRAPAYPPSGNNPGQGYPPNSPPVQIYPVGEGEYTLLLIDPEVRNRFLRKVFIILFVMLAVSTLMIVSSISFDPWREFFQSPAGELLFWMAIAGIFILAYFMCCPLILRIPPVGCMVLFLAVVCYTIISCVISVRMRTELVFYAFLATSALMLICVFLAFTKFDFTSWLLYLIAFSLVFTILVMCVCVATMVMRIYMKPLHIAILLIGTIVNCMFLIMELQMVIGGKKVELNEDDYVVGVFLLYTSIMSLLIKMLQLFDLLDD